MNLQLLLNGIKAMILGMGMVYFFLIIMIWIMHLTAKLLKPFNGLLEKQPAVSRAKSQNQKPAHSNQELAEAAITAVQQYRHGNYSNMAQTFNIPVRGTSVKVSVEPGSGCASSPQQSLPAVSSAGDLLSIKSPLPGTMIRLVVSEGDRITGGDLLAVIEAMKMETEIKAESDGIVREIMFSVKDVVAAGDPLFLLEVTK